MAPSAITLSTITHPWPIWTRRPTRVFPRSEALGAPGDEELDDLEARLEHHRQQVDYRAEVRPLAVHGVELRGLAADGHLALTLTLTGDAADWTHSRGRAGAAHLSDLVTPHTLAFVCGPPAMVAELPAALVSLGLPRERVRTEDW